jgi:hypothetical protein
MVLSHISEKIKKAIAAKTQSISNMARMRPPM